MPLFKSVKLFSVSLHLRLLSTIDLALYGIFVNVLERKNKLTGFSQTTSNLNCTSMRKYDFCQLLSTSFSVVFSPFEALKYLD